MEKEIRQIKNRRDRINKSSRRTPLLEGQRRKDPLSGLTRALLKILMKKVKQLMASDQLETGYQEDLWIERPEWVILTKQMQDNKIAQDTLKHILGFKLYADPEKEGSGAWNPSEKQIAINLGHFLGLRPQELEHARTWMSETLRHEIQHALQDVTRRLEGYNKGEGPFEYLNEPREIEAFAADIAYRAYNKGIPADFLLRRHLQKLIDHPQYDQLYRKYSQAILRLMQKSPSRSKRKRKKDQKQKKARAQIEGTLREEILIEGQIRDYLAQSIRKLKGREKSFAKRLHRRVGTDGLLDLADDLAAGNRPATKLVLKELFLWMGVPIGGALAAHAMGLPWATGLLLKSAAWLTLVQMLQQEAEAKKDTTESSDDTTETGDPEPEQSDSVSG